jgi:uncharacterized protein YggE
MRSSLITHSMLCLLASVVTNACMPEPAKAQAPRATCALKDAVPSLTTTGVASVDVVPDSATVVLGVVTERPKAADAARENAAAAQAVVAEIKAQGVEAKDIKTRSVALSPVYDEIRDNDGRTTRRALRGYSARNELAVRVRELGKVGDLVARWIDKGANRVDEITFDVEAKDVKYEALRVDAVRDALRKAQSYATGLGLRLGRVLAIAPPSSGYTAVHPTVAYARAPASDGSVPVPVEPGVQTLRTEIEVTWELAQ